MSGLYSEHHLQVWHIKRECKAEQKSGSLKPKSEHVRHSKPPTSMKGDTESIFHVTDSSSGLKKVREQACFKLQVGEEIKRTKGMNGIGNRLEVSSITSSKTASCKQVLRYDAEEKNY